MSFPVVLILCLAFLSVSVSAQESSDCSVCVTTGYRNVNPDPRGEPWLVRCETKFSEEDFAKIPSYPSERGLKKSTVALPARVDNSTQKYMRPVFNQYGSSCGAAGGVGYVFNYEMNWVLGTAANVVENQYSYGYTWRFLNGGTDNGSWFYDGWDIIKKNGIPNAKEYGGFSITDNSTWTSGYATYYNGMRNGVKGYYKIEVKTSPQTLDIVKGWLFDHRNGSAAGGILTYDTDWDGIKMVKIPSGLPEAGKNLITAFGTSGGHTQTIVGYDDNVKYDVNGDGKFTNNIDITNDGIVDLRDWEIGAFIMVNSWGTSWADAGKAYILYRVIALPLSQGGMRWNSVYYVDAEKRTPKMTYKIKITHDKRNQIKIVAGVSSNLTAATPSATKDYGYGFNYSGGSLPMQGQGKSSTIEIGLDVSDILPTMTNNKAAFFLQVTSKGGTGVINNFSVMDYRSGTLVETPCTQTNVSITTGATAKMVVVNTMPVTSITDNNLNRMSSDIAFNVKGNTLSYQVPGIPNSKDQVVIGLYTLRGVLVKNMVMENQSAGSYRIELDKQSNGDKVTANSYICRISYAGNQKSLIWRPVK
jgi:hypothetical protein